MYILGGKLLVEWFPHLAVPAPDSLFAQSIDLVLTDFVGSINT